MTKHFYRLVMMTAALILAPALVSSLTWQNDVDQLRSEIVPAGAMWVDSLDLSNISQGYGEPHGGKSVDGLPLTLHGVVYPHGVGTHADSEFNIILNGCALRFESIVGVDDETQGKGSVDFQVYADGKKLADSGILHGNQTPVRINVPLTGVRKLQLIVSSATDGIDFDHADWAGAMLILNPNSHLKPQSGVTYSPPRLTAPMMNPVPAIHGPWDIGSTPGYPFLFLIPATGEGPLRFSAKNLPDGISLDSTTGILSGSLIKSGLYLVHLHVRGSDGSCSRDLLIVGGKHKLALTPPMGWNSWNVWAGAVNQDRVQAAGDSMVSAGLAAHGFQYVNIDDTWEGPRGADGTITTNSKFPNMRALADHIHSLGLKLGIYSSPGPTTCGGYPGSYKHEQQDADTYAKWGIDYLKYDWCSYENVATGQGLERLQKPYVVMRQALDNAPRDILFSFCQYGMGDVWKWGAAIGGNCWRTTGDINDSWGSLHGIIESQVGHEKYAGPGHWNDPDMLVVGRVGWGNPHPSHLTPNEQIMHITMWCMLSAPLLIGCDITRLDPFTLTLLANDEALEINQDPLGHAASRISNAGDAEIWARPLSDGTEAVALLNMGIVDLPVTANWKALGLKGKQPVRDLWMHKNLGGKEDSITMKVPAHGAILLKIGRPHPIHLLNLGRKLFQ